MTAAVRKTDEELISNKMTDWGSSNGLMGHNEKYHIPGPTAATYVQPRCRKRASKAKNRAGVGVFRVKRRNFAPEIK